MARYSREQRDRAVDLYVRYERCAADVIRELGYPSRGALWTWYKDRLEEERTGVPSMRGERYMDWLQCIRQSDEGRMAWDWRPTMAGPKHPRHHDEAFKRQIVQSCESGKPSREIRAGYDIARSTPRRWVQGIRDSGSARAADNRTPGRNEPVEPGRRNRRLEMEVDVSEQAAPVFARRQA